MNTTESIESFNTNHMYGQNEGLRQLAEHLTYISAIVHRVNEKWWIDPTTGKNKDRNVGEMLCLVHSENSEALEGHRKNLMVDKLPHRKMLEVELADALIRIMDISAGLGLDIGGAFSEKMAYNAIREDHKLENRIKPGGKAY